MIHFSKHLYLEHKRSSSAILSYMKCAFLFTANAFRFSIINKFYLNFFIRGYMVFYPPGFIKNFFGVTDDL